MSKHVEDHILKQYKLIRLMGSGAYGHVWKVQEKQSKKHFALKKVFDAFRNSIDAQRTYRQVEILHRLKHDNIVKLHKVIKSINKKDLYMVFEFMEADLHSVVGANILQKIHQVYVFYQILKGVKYLHSGQLIHRDLKPSNVLIDSECNAKLCDFGLVRSLASPEDQQVILSEEVATKWYRAPELLLGSRTYNKPVDLWSIGCIVAEILMGRPMFAGNSTLNQLQKILQFFGEVSKDDLQSLESPIADNLMSQIKIKKKSFREYFSNVDPDFYPLINGLLTFNPSKRLTVDEALSLKIFEEFKEEIETLPILRQPISPIVNDNVRFGLKLYREKIYDDIDYRYKSPKSVKMIRNKVSQSFQSQEEFNKKNPMGPKRKSKKKYSSTQKLNQCLENMYSKKKQKCKSPSLGMQRRKDSNSSVHIIDHNPLQKIQVNSVYYNSKKNIMSPKALLTKFYGKVLNQAPHKPTKIIKKRMGKYDQQNKRQQFKQMTFQKSPSKKLNRLLK